MANLKYALIVFSLCGALTSSAEDLQSVKAQILNLAETYSGQADLDGLKAKSFQPLIAQLLSLSAPQTMNQKAVTAVGAWKQVWGPYSYNNSKVVSTSLDPNNIYQVISATGFYTNVGINKFLGLPVIGLLKGQYIVTPEKINVEFKESGILLEKVPPGFTLADLPALKEEGKLCILEFPKFLSPVGIKGALIEIYVDSTLRITFGEQQGKLQRTLYIMQRVVGLPY